MGFRGLTKEQKEKLKFEVVSEEARLKLTRMLREYVKSEDVFNITLANRVVNIAHNVLGLPLYILRADEWGEYHPAEFVWHHGEVEILMRRPDTVKLVETLADLIVDDYISISEVNEILEADNSSVFFEEKLNGELEIYIASIEEIEESKDESEHVNIRLLINRMEVLFDNKDFSGVLHTCGSIFETLAKDVIQVQSIQDQSLGSFFDKYRNDSNLPDSVLDYILDIFKKRNTEPLAGHGSTQEPTVSREDAIVIMEMTKSFIRIERELSKPQTFLKKDDKNDE